MYRSQRTFLYQQSRSFCSFLKLFRHRLTCQQHLASGSTALSPSLVTIAVQSTCQTEQNVKRHSSMPAWSPARFLPEIMVFASPPYLMICLRQLLPIFESRCIIGGKGWASGVGSFSMQCSQPHAKLQRKTGTSSDIALLFRLGLNGSMCSRIFWPRYCIDFYSCRR